MILHDIRKYFKYDDKLSRIVSLFTGFFILLYNFFSGWLIIFIIGKTILGFDKPQIAILLLYIIPGIIAGYWILKFCIFLSGLIHRGTIIENYSYLRLILLVTVIVYLLIMIIFFILNLTLFFII